MGKELHRHLQALLVTISIVSCIGMAYYWYYNVPVNVYDIRIVNVNIKTEDKLMVTYRIARQHQCAVATLIAQIDDGIEIVRTHRSSLYEGTFQPQDDLVTKDIGVPGFSASGKARLILNVEYICHRLHEWAPLKVYLGTFSFNVIDKAALIEDKSQTDEILRLRSEVAGLNAKVFNLTAQVESLTGAFNKNRIDNTPSIITKPSEQRLRVSTDIHSQQMPTPSPDDQLPKPIPGRPKAKADDKPLAISLAPPQPKPAPDPIGDFFKKAYRSLGSVNLN